MTLAIFVNSPDPQVETRIWSAGFENSRSNLWGSQQFSELGLRLLPAIRDDVNISSQEFDELLSECAAVETRLSIASERKGREDIWWHERISQLSTYMVNFRSAVRFARSVGAAGLEVG